MKSWNFHFASLLALLAIDSPSASAEATGPLGWGKPNFQSELISDRPDFTESVETIDAGHLQVEGGYTFSEGDDVHSHTFPELLVRVGLVQNSELRLGWTGAELNEADDDTEEDSEGLSDLSVGAKVQIVKEQPQLPDASLIFELGVPTGASAVSARGVEPTVKFLWSCGLAEDLDLGGNVNFSARSDGNGHFFEITPTLSLGAGLTEEIGMYFEYFGILPNDTETADDEHYADSGLTYAVTDDLQLDIRIGVGLNSTADDLFTGIGFAVRL